MNQFKNILVTGGAGFIGSNFLNYALEKYPEIHFYNLDCLNYCASQNNVNEQPNYHFVEGKIQDRYLILHLLKSHQIDAVIHFAAQSHVDNSFENSLSYTEDNILGTHVLLEACRQYGQIKRFLHFSTDEVYGESQIDDALHKNEQSVMCPTNPYAATKAGAELIARAYYYSYKMPIIVTRGNNVYGPRQYLEKLIPRFIHLLATDQKCTIHGTGQNTRSFIYVDDVSRAVETVLSRGQPGEIYNIGSEDEYSVMEIADMLIKRLKPESGERDQHLIYVPDRVYNDQRYFISNDKIKALGWCKEVSFQEGLEKTIQWYLQTDLKLHWTT